MVRLEAGEQHLKFQGAETLNCVAMCFDGPTLLLNHRLARSPPVDFESFRVKHAILLDVWRMLALNPVRRVLPGLTDASWEEHRKRLMDAKTLQ